MTHPGSYSLLIVSAIPVFGDPASGCRALDLWARDLSFQAKVTPDCCVVCPVKPLQARPENSVTLPKSVRIVPDDDVTSPRAAEALIEGYDVVQISGGRKNKLRPGDLLGALTAEGGVPGNTVGSIDLFDTYSYVAVRNAQVKKALQQLADRPIKGRKYRARVRK